MKNLTGAKAINYLKEYTFVKEKQLDDYFEEFVSKEFSQKFARTDVTDQILALAKLAEIIEPKIPPINAVKIKV